MKDREYWIKWSKAAGIRAVKTIAETAISLIGADMVNIVSLDWVNIAGVCATAGGRVTPPSFVWKKGEEHGKFKSNRCKRTSRNY